ncbi:MliC family protein [Paracoccus caeni]|uniref:MliC family protein n=1 Tax=Paracoccus caeni TaxID=657651 RepID=A0A934SHB8_9RHOB|nr:MliC family protein [Paracoccus caeni]MBK4217076.1 MliC family protein [Paracoccus caeni]
MTRFFLPLLALGAISSPAFAEATLSLSLKTGAEGGIVSASYSCDGGAAFPVQYINSETNNLALLPIDGEERVFVNVISGSGARYVSGQYEWWSKGETATLRDEMADTSQDCTETAATESQ